MNWLEDLVSGYVEGERIKTLGPDYKQKRALMEAQTRGVDAETGLKGAQAGEVAANTNLVMTHGQQLVDEMRRAGATDADLQKLYEAGITPVASAGALKALGTYQQESSAARNANVNADQSLKETANMGTPADAKALRQATLASVMAQARAHNASAAKQPVPSYMKATDQQGNEVFADRNDPRFKTGELRPPAPVAMQNREMQAGIIQNAGQQLLAAIDAGDKAGVIGPRAGRMQGAQEGMLGVITGGPNPAYAGLKAQLGSFEALLPILHGFRGGPQVIAQFQHAMGGGLNQPKENLVAAINAVLLLANDIAKGSAVPISGADSRGVSDLPGGGWNQEAASAAPAGGTTRWIQGPDGKLVKQ